MPAEAKLVGSGLRRAVAETAAEVALASPWLLFAWFNYAIACHRWIGWQFTLSMGVSVVAAAVGWWLVRRAVARCDDAKLGDLLAPVPDASEWTLFPHPAQILKRQHWARCQRRWGVTPRTSGWQRFCRSWRADATKATVCLVGVAHALWLGC